MNNDSFEDDLTKHLAEINKVKQPKRDLWQGIELALVEESATIESQVDKITPNNKFYLIAATVAMFGWMAWFSLYQNQSDLVGTELVASLSDQHLKQKKALLASYQQQTALTENWQQQLSDLDEAAKAVKTALENEPNNMTLLKMLQNVHQQQINLIEKVHTPKWSQI